MEKLGTWFKFRHFFWIFPRRHLDDESLIVQVQGKIFQASCIRNHIPIIIIFKLIDTVNIYFGYTPVLKQALFIIHSMPVEQFHRTVRMNTAFINGYIF